MRNYRPVPRRYVGQKGRRRVVSAFTSREGFWVLGIITWIMVGIIVMWLLGFIRLDAD